MLNLIYQDILLSLVRSDYLYPTAFSICRGLSSKTTVHRVCHFDWKQEEKKLQNFHPKEKRNGMKMNQPKTGNNRYHFSLDDGFRCTLREKRKKNYNEKFFYYYFKLIEKN